MNRRLISDILTPDMVTEDSLGNSNYEFEQDFFSDSEETNQIAKMKAISVSLASEIERFRPVNIVTSESGKAWENTEYWSSKDGDILISNLEDKHLSRIPRHLYNNGIVKNSKDLPPRIVEEIAKRGFILSNNCIVTMCVLR